MAVQCSLEGDALPFHGAEDLVIGLLAEAGMVPIAGMAALKVTILPLRSMILAKSSGLERASMDPRSFAAGRKKSRRILRLPSQILSTKRVIMGEGISS
jgi:hypothetical protein